MKTFTFFSISCYYMAVKEKLLYFLLLLLNFVEVADSAMRIKKSIPTSAPHGHVCLD